LDFSYKINIEHIFLVVMIVPTLKLT